IDGVKSDPDVAKLGTAGAPNNIGVQQLITRLQAKLDAANDHIDFGFLHVQTDIYRSRQLMLGNEAGTRLATSPALATIATGVSAAATKQDLSNLVAKLKSGALTTTPPPPASGGGGSTANPGGGNLFIAGSSDVRRIATEAAFQPIKSLEVATAPTKTIETLSAGFKNTSAQELKITPTAGSSALFASKASSPTDVIEQRPIVGAVYDLRTTSVVERLKDPPATEAKQFTVASKFSVLDNFIKLAKDDKNPGIVIDDISVPGFLAADKTETTKKFSEITPAVLGEVLGGTHDPIATDDESGRFTASVRAMEHTTSILRLLEGRVQAYKNAIDLCNTALDSM